MPTSQKAITNHGNDLRDRVKKGNSQLRIEVENNPLRFFCGSNYVAELMNAITVTILKNSTDNVSNAQLLQSYRKSEREGWVGERGGQILQNC